MDIAAIYHAGCMDGFGAVWALSHSDMARKYKTDEFRHIPMKYDEPLPWGLPGADRLYIVDFSFPPEVMDVLCDRYSEVVLIDHHKTAAETLSNYEHPNLEKHIDMDYSGAVLTWMVVNPDEDVPQICLYVQDRDLWRFDMPESEAINIWLSNQPRTFEYWDHAESLLKHHYESCVSQGYQLLSYRDNLVEVIREKVQHEVATIDGKLYRVGQVNAPVLQSEVAHAILNTMDVDIADVWFSVGSETTHSLRSRKGEVDVSEIAKKLGGGGHPSAAGFRTIGIGVHWVGGSVPSKPKE